ncbi:MAG: hypothetical protein ABL921_24150 [Pirellula sp.]
MKTLTLANGDPDLMQLALVDFLVGQGPAHLRHAIEASAIPHWFDASILTEILDDALKQDSRSLFEHVINLPICETYPVTGTFCLKKLPRLAVRDHLWKNCPDRLQSLSFRAGDAFSLETEPNRIERVYHALCSKPEVAASILFPMVEGPHQQVRKDELLSLAAVFREFLVAKKVPPLVLAWAIWVQITAQSSELNAEQKMSYARAGYEAARSSGDTIAIATLSEQLGDLFSCSGNKLKACEYLLESKRNLDLSVGDTPLGSVASLSVQRLSAKLVAFGSPERSDTRENDESRFVSVRPESLVREQLLNEDDSSPSTRNRNQPQSQNRLFVSAVTSEFENTKGPHPGLRAKLRNYLARAGCDVKVQEDFRQTPVDTLQKLDGYIRSCSAVIHLVGGMAGEKANPQAVRDFLDAEPSFLKSRPELRDALGHFSDLTYTQWEAFIALHHEIPLFVYSTEDAATNQKVHLERLRIGRRHAESFRTAEELLGKLIGDLRAIVPLLPDYDLLEDFSGKVKKQNERFLSVSKVELINDKLMPRSESQQILDALDSADTRGVLLVAEAGFGKSCILVNLMELLKNRDVLCLAFKLDSINECTSADQLGKAIDLPDSPVKVLAAVSPGRPCVLIVDQLDAISTVSGRKTNMWIAFDELRRQAESYPGMKLVVACRGFDLQQDHRLRKLDGEGSKFERINVTRLGESDLRSALDLAELSHFFPTPQQIEILRLPFHLVLFLQGYPERAFSRIGDLYDNYWERKQDVVRERLGREPAWNEVIDGLTKTMSERQSLTAPKDIVDSWRSDAREMASQHLLIDNGASYQFFHESFFDYAFARRFCQLGQSLLGFLTQPGEQQHLFRRAQVRQILGYRRENRPAEYLRDLCEVLASKEVRFHIRRMIASELRRIPNPREDEWKIIEPYVLESELSGAVSNALRGSIGWFDLLSQHGVLAKWLASNETKLNNAAIWLLQSEDLHKQRSEQVAILVEPNTTHGGEWNNRLKKLMMWGVAHYSTKMTELYFGMIRRGIYDDGEKRPSGGDFWGGHYGAKKENPKFIIDLIRCWLVNAVEKYDDGRSWNFLGQLPLNNSRTGANLASDAANDEPKYFVEQLLPVIMDTVAKTEMQKSDRRLNRTWPYLSNFGDPSKVSEAVLACMSRALRRLAIEAPDTFRKTIVPLQDQQNETICFLVLSAFAANPKEFADECINYFIADKSRLNVGYSLWSGDGHGESAVSRQAIAAVSPYCTKDSLRHLEDAVIGYCDAYEKESIGRRGFGELLVLQSIDETRRSQRVIIRISELKCSFPGLSSAVPDEDETMEAHWVGSPIPEGKSALMTNDQWLSAMQTYNGTTDRFAGGHVELSRDLESKVRGNRLRFASLVSLMSNTIDPLYFSAILDGMSGSGHNATDKVKESESARIATVQTNVFENVIRRLHDLPNHPCGTAIASCFEKLSSRNWSDEILDILVFYATQDPDPESEVWKSDGDEVNYYDGDPYTHGINTVRGQAARAIGAMLYDHADRVDRFQPCIQSLIADPILSVRTCAIDTLRPILNYDRDSAVRLFLECCGDAEPIWSTIPFKRFIKYAILTHYADLRALLQRCLASSNSLTVKNAVTLLLHAEFNQMNLGEDTKGFQTGSDAIREAASLVFAQNIDNPEIGDRCAELLAFYFDDENEAVRQNCAAAFWNMEGERLLKLEAFILKFIESRSFKSEPESLLRALDDSLAELPKVICRATERILEFVGEEAGNLANKEAAYAYSLSTLIVRQYAQTIDDKLKRHCLDLIDQMESKGYMGIADELGKLDR